jgi:hypothetical protein
MTTTGRLLIAFVVCGLARVVSRTASRSLTRTRRQPRAGTPSRPPPTIPPRSTTTRRASLSFRGSKSELALTGSRIRPATVRLPVRNRSPNVVTRRCRSFITPGRRRSVRCRLASACLRRLA